MREEWNQYEIKRLSYNNCLDRCDYFNIFSWTRNKEIKPGVTISVKYN